MRFKTTLEVSLKKHEHREIIKKGRRNSLTLLCRTSHRRTKRQDLMKGHWRTWCWWYKFACLEKYWCFVSWRILW